MVFDRTTLVVIVFGLWLTSLLVRRFVMFVIRASLAFDLLTPYVDEIDAIITNARMHPVIDQEHFARTLAFYHLSDTLRRMQAKAFDRGLGLSNMVFVLNMQGRHKDIQWYQHLNSISLYSPHGAIEYDLQ